EGSAEGDRAELRQLLQRVAGVDLTQRARLRTHDQRLCGGTELVILDTLEELTVGDAGGGEEAVVALDEVIGGQERVKLVAGVDGGIPLGIVARVELALDLGAHALERGGGDDTFGRPADAEEDVDAGTGPARGDGAGHVTVGDEADAHPG